MDVFFIADVMLQANRQNSVTNDYQSTVDAEKLCLKDLIV
jgi:hypothetical protein